MLMHRYGSRRLQLAKVIGQSVGNFSKQLGLGDGGVMPGHVALRLAPDIFSLQRKLLQRGCVFVTGTNGKSTVTRLIAHLLQVSGYRVVTNVTGANLASGIAASLLAIDSPVDYGVFEVDEAALPVVAPLLSPTHVVLLNFSRDQLDRYAEIDRLTERIRTVLDPKRTEVIYNSADKRAAQIGLLHGNGYGYYVAPRIHDGLNETVTCAVCTYGRLYYRRFGGPPDLACDSCQLPKGSASLAAHYREASYQIHLMHNVLRCQTRELADSVTAATLLMLRVNLSPEEIMQRLSEMRLEEAHRRVIPREQSGDTSVLRLAKNPVSFNRVLRSQSSVPGATLVLAVNRNIADGRDTSWLWDVDFESLKQRKVDKIYVLGQAAADLRLRLAVASVHCVEEVSLEVLLDIIRHEQVPIQVIANYTAYREIEAALGTSTTTTSQATEVLMGYKGLE